MTRADMEGSFRDFRRHHTSATKLHQGRFDMALVAYSDSEGSDNEASAAAAKAPVARTAPFQKTEARKIQVNLPRLKAEPGENADGTDQPAAKRAKTAGAFGGFNSLLPAPKRAAAQPSGLKKGVGLKTSSEAAFTRAPPPAIAAPGSVEGDDDYDEFGIRRVQLQEGNAPNQDGSVMTKNEVKIVGKATRFRPLSVANNSKKKKVSKKAGTLGTSEPAQIGAAVEEKPILVSEKDTSVAAAPVPAPKKSLFSMTTDEDVTGDHLDEDFEAEAPSRIAEAATGSFGNQSQPLASAPDPNSLDAVAADLNLTPAQRRQLFGRHGKGVPANIAHFNMDAEYRANEEIRQSGETIEHKAVKTVAPGKHSLQQLVNNARSNQESIEDKWAEGRRNRGEGGSKYGWSSR